MSSGGVPIEYCGKIIGEIGRPAVPDARPGLNLRFAVWKKPIQLWAVGPLKVDEIVLTILELDGTGQPSLFQTHSLRNLRYLHDFRPEDSAIDALRAADGTP